jgi:hypothetical protein
VSLSLVDVEKKKKKKKKEERKREYTCCLSYSVWRMWRDKIGIMQLNLHFPLSREESIF